MVKTNMVRMPSMAYEPNEANYNTYKSFKFGIWDRVDGMGPINWLSFKILNNQALIKNQIWDAEKF